MPDESQEFMDALNDPRVHAPRGYEPPPGGTGDARPEPPLARALPPGPPGGLGYASGRYPKPPTPPGFGWGVALVLLGVPVLTGVGFLLWGLYVASGRTVIVLLLGAAAWGVVGYFVCRAFASDRPSPRRVLVGMLAGVGFALLLLVGLAGLVLGLCYVAAR